jgi:tetratricopeptide (TPR) repeat protein
VDHRTPLDPTDFVVKSKLLLAHSQTRALRNDRPGALVLAKEAIELGRKMLKELDADAIRQQVARAQYAAADLIRQINDIDMRFLAQEYIQEGLKTATFLVARDSGAVARRRLEGDLYLALGDFERWQMRSSAAMDAYREMKKIREWLLKMDPRNPNVRNDYGFALIKNGEQFSIMKDCTNAMKDFQEARDLYDELVQTQSSALNWMRWRWTARQGIVKCKVTSPELRATPELRAELEQAADELVRVAKVNTYYENHQLSDQANLMEAFKLHGDAFSAVGKLDEAEEKYSEALAVADRVDWETARSYRIRRLKASALEARALALSKRQHKPARKFIDESLVLWEDDSKKNEGDMESLAHWALAQGSRARIMLDAGDTRAASADLRIAISRMRKVVAKLPHHPDWPGALRKLEALLAQAESPSPGDSVTTGSVTR